MCSNVPTVQRSTVQYCPVQCNAVQYSHGSSWCRRHNSTPLHTPAPHCTGSTSSQAQPNPLLRVQQLRWQARLALTAQQLSAREPLLSLRRQLAELLGDRDATGRCWLQHAKLCRTTGWQLVPDFCPSVHLSIRLKVCHLHVHCVPVPSLSHTFPFPPLPCPGSPPVVPVEQHAPHTLTSRAACPPPTPPHQCDTTHPLPLPPPPSLPTRTP